MNNPLNKNFKEIGQGVLDDSVIMEALNHPENLSLLIDTMGRNVDAKDFLKELINGGDLRTFTDQYTSPENAGKLMSEQGDASRVPPRGTIDNHRMENNIPFNDIWGNTDVPSYAANIWNGLNASSKFAIIEGIRNGEIQTSDDLLTKMRDVNTRFMGSKDIQHENGEVERMRNIDQ